MKLKLPNIFKPFGLMARFIKDVIMLVKNRVDTSIRFQLMLTCGISLLLSMLVFSVSNSFFGQFDRYAYIDYSSGRAQLDNLARRLVEDIQRNTYNLPQLSVSGTSTAQSPGQPKTPEQPQTSERHQASEQTQSSQPPQNSEQPQTTQPESQPSGQPSEPGPQTPAGESAQQPDSGAKQPQSPLLPGERDLATFQNLLNQEAQDFRAKIMIVDLEGKILIASGNSSEVQVDLNKVVESAMNARLERSEEREFYSLYPVSYKGFKGYAVVSGFPQPTLAYAKRGDSTLALLNALAAFILIFLVLTTRKMRYFEYLANGLLEISKGNLDYRVETRTRDELGSLACNINHMAQELKTTIEEERRAERTKNELITNVSHDLRTPLTSIMGYLRLLKDGKFQDEQELKSFVNIAYGKSEKLKSLIEDLFQFTRLSSEELKPNLTDVCLNDLLEQLMEELVPICEENSLGFEHDLPRERIMVRVDGDKTVRVFENLLMNAVKYSYKPGTIKVNLAKTDDRVTVSIHNNGEPISEQDLNNLFERFYRVEKSRSSETGGTGLGLAIAKSIVERQGGQIWAECSGEEIGFFVSFPSA